MKKKFIFAVLVMLAFSLSIGCANEPSVEVQVPIEYTITNNYSDGTNISVRFCETGSLPNTRDEWKWEDEIIQVLTPPQYIENGKTKTIIIDATNCMEYNGIFVETTWTRNGKCVGIGYIDWFDIHWVLTEGNGQREIELTGNW